MYLPDNHPLKDFFAFVIMIVIALACIGLLFLPFLFLKPHTLAGNIYCYFLIIVWLAALLTGIKHIIESME